MQAFDRFAELWSEYLEGELDDGGMAELRELLTSQPECKSAAMEQYQIHRALGILSQENSEAFVRTTLQRVPDSTDDFVAKVVARVQSLPRPERAVTIRTKRIKGQGLLLGVCTVATLFLCLYLYRSEDPHRVPAKPLASAAASHVKFTNTARTKFLGAYTPAIGAEVRVDHEYILTSGSVQMLFPTGAEVIVQGPAVFQVTEGNRLAVSVGRCSVYCPPGAEGFVVDTPSAQVVDRGTRFFVNVVESSATEVHVVDGVAEVFQQAKLEPSTQARDSQVASSHSSTGSGSTSDMVRLTRHEARMIESDSDFAPRPTEYRSSLYQYRLPDRIVSYQATQENGGAKDLISVDVQRDGKVLRFPVDSLIGSRLRSFKIEEKIVDMRHLAGNPPLPADRLEVMSDTALNTGAINPGGAWEPFRGNPTFPGHPGDTAEDTPGLAIEFIQPVINGPGPDVILFELQNVAGAPDGDPFHVLPWQLTGNRKAFTVKSYDLTLTSPEVQRPADFYLYDFDGPVNSLEELVSAPCRVLTRPQGSAGYRVLAVAIDLSSLGYENGEPVNGLFIQDCLDDQNHVDPVAIFGLPMDR